MKRHDWKLVDLDVSSSIETTFSWYCKGCGSRENTHARANVGEHGAHAYKPLGKEDCEEALVRNIMKS